MRLRDFVRINADAIDAVINAETYRHDGNGGRGSVPRPAPQYDSETRQGWVMNNEGLYLWARRSGVKI